MRHPSCPDEARLIEFVDDALPREAMQRTELHVRGCSRCAETVSSLKQLCADIRAPLAGELDVPAHVEAVLARLDRPRAPAKSWRRPLFIAAFSGAAAAFALLAVSTRRHGDVEYQARGAASPSSLQRDVGIEPFAYGGNVQRLNAGARLRADTPLGASYRNLGKAPAYLLLFALDAQGEVHWISPEYTQAGSDPAATPLPPSQTARALETSVVLSDVAPGPLRVISLVTREPTHVSNVEQLGPRDLEPEALRRRFVGSVVHATPIELTSAEPGTP